MADWEQAKIIMQVIRLTPEQKDQLEKAQQEARSTNGYIARQDLEEFRTKIAV
jgi:Spy/CpxP family protein refolding chaperone